MNKKSYSLILSIISCFCLSGCNKKATTTVNDRYTEGFEAGKTEGYTDGYTAGKTDGTNEGYNEGYEDGKNSGGTYDDGFFANEMLYDIHTLEQNEYLHGTSLDVSGSIDGKHEMSKPQHVVINGSYDDRYNEADVNYYLLKLSKNMDMSSSIEYRNNSNKQFVLKNLNIGTRYFYTITAFTDNASFTTPVKSFSTNDQAPRNIDIDGVTNCRDQGGWKIVGSNQKTVQNLIYRTAKLHDDYVANVTEQGCNDIKQLGIKTEIDLRDPTYSGLHELHTAVEGLNYYNCGMEGEGYFNNEVDKQGVKKTFEVLSDVSNYPVLYHCAIGTDRTGFISFLNNCLAGISLDDMCRDYVFSSFGNINGIRKANVIQDYANRLNNDYSANGNYTVGATNFLKSIGVTTGQINVVKNMIKNGQDNTTHHEASSWAVSSLDPEHYHEKICTDPDCGVTVHKEVHQFNELIVDQPATISENGHGHHTCTVCGYEKEEVLPKSGVDFKFVGMKSYGNATTFTIKVGLKLENINGESTNIKLYKGSNPIENVSFTYTKGADDEDYSTIKIDLSAAVNNNDIVYIPKGTILSDGTNHFVLSKDAFFTYDGSGFYPSFLKDPTPISRKSGNNIEIEYQADFTDFLGGQAADGVQPYYTRGKGSNFTYTLTRNDVVIKTYVNDCVNDNHNEEVKTQVFWVSAELIRIAFDTTKLTLSDGDIFCIKKGSVYADNGYHEGGVNDVRKYILHKDLSVRFNSSTGLFEPIV